MTSRARRHAWRHWRQADRDQRAEHAKLRILKIGPILSEIRPFLWSHAFPMLHMEKSSWSSYYKIVVSFCAWESGCKPHWQGASSYKHDKRLESNKFCMLLGDSTCGQRAVYQLGMTGIPVYNVSGISQYPYQIILTIFSNLLPSWSVPSIVKRTTSESDIL